MENLTVYPKPSEPKLSKEAAGYAAKGPFGCINCRWYAPKAKTSILGGCAVTGGQVSAEGCCDYWDEASAPQGIGKAKAEYIFVSGSNYTCAECVVFDPVTKTCSYVVGSIAPGASCNKFRPLGWVGGRMSEVADLIRESALEALREAGFDTRGSSSVGGPTSGTFPPGGAPDDGGKITTPSNVQAPGATAEMRGAAQAKGVSGFFTGQGAPLETADMIPPKTGGHSHHVSDNTGDAGLPGPSEHVSECAICSHSKALHEVEGVSPGGCLYCWPRESFHRFTESLTLLDMTPRVVTVGGRATEVLSTVEAHRRMFSEVEQAQIRLSEAAANGSDNKSRVYTAHSNAAMRQSVQAFNSGDSSHHEVAAAHHELASAAAAKASDGASDDQDKKDFKTMASFHSSQADAHKRAASVAKKGNLTPGYAYNY